MTGWRSAPPVLELAPDQVDIWRVDLELSEAAFNLMQASLSADESARAARFHFEADGRRYIAAHACLRNVLARYLALDPRELDFRAGSHGKPELAGLARERAIEFNLSHSGRFALIGVTRNRRIGVDVEIHRPDLTTEELARHYFSAREVSQLFSLRPEERQIAFFNCWTRKEAYIKAHGLGLHLPLDSFDVSLAASGVDLLEATQPDPHQAARWTLRHLDVHPGYGAAAAVEGRELSFRLWNWGMDGA